MALSSDEAWRSGFVRDPATQTLVTTTSLTGARWQGGFLRDPYGRLVVVNG